MITESPGDLAVIEGVVSTAPAIVPAGDLALGAERRAAVNPYRVYLASLATANGKRKMALCLDQITCMALGVTYRPGISGDSGIGARFPWEQLRYQHTAAIRSALAQLEWSPSYTNCCLTALRKVLEAAWNLELIGGDDYQRARSVKGVRGYRVPAGRDVHPDEIIRMRDVCLAEEGLRAIRDAALILILWSTGIREAEAATVRIECYSAAERSLKVIGKANKERYVYVHENAVVALERWLAALGARSGPIFRPVDKWGRVAEKPVSPVTVYYIVNQRRIQVGLPRLTPHDFRRTFTGDLLDADANLPQAQQLLGHDSVHTTAKYVRHNARELRAAVDRIPIPPMPALGEGAGA